MDSMTTKKLKQKFGVVEQLSWIHFKLNGKDFHVVSVERAKNIIARMLKFAFDDHGFELFEDKNFAMKFVDVDMCSKVCKKLCDQEIIDPVGYLYENELDLFMALLKNLDGFNWEEFNKSLYNCDPDLYLSYISEDGNYLRVDDLVVYMPIGGVQ